MRVIPRATAAVLLTGLLFAAPPEAHGPCTCSFPQVGAGGWTTGADPARGYEVRLPPGWQLSSESLTPRLTEPRELLSAGTFPLRFREAPCNHMPVGALRAIGPEDGFVTILERGRDPGSSWSEFAPRPDRFAGSAEPQRGDVSDCLDAQPGLVEYWTPFTDADRHLYAMVVLGPEASESIRSEAFALLDSLRLDPVQPGWEASP